MYFESQVESWFIDEMTRTDHRRKGNFKKNHPNTGQKPSTLDRNEFSRHTESEHDSGRLCGLPKQK